MASEAHQLQMFFLPFLAPGHMIPMVDMARLFAARGVSVTIITTPYNALLFHKAIDRDVKSGHHIEIHKLRFPSTEVGLPEGVENFNSVTSPQMHINLFRAILMLQQSIEQLFRERRPRPDCIVSDTFFPWTADVASQLGIPRLVFHGSSFFSHCAADTIRRNRPHLSVQSDTESFVMSGLPDKIEMTRLQLPDWVRAQNDYSHLMDQIIDSELRSYGVVANSFYELESAYVDHYRKSMGRKGWSIGPVSLCVNRDTADKTERGNKAFFDGHNCLSWLDSKEPNSVLYVNFGSLTKFPTAQVLEIASGLQASGHPFIWVVRMAETSKEEDDKRWLPEGFEERMMEGNKCLIIRDWAPQILILDHPAIRGLVTHCGWNSILEGVTAGLPMITWPLFAEQFYNEKLVTQVMKIGVGVGVEAWASSPEQQAKTVVKREKIEKAVTMLMSSGEEAEDMRKRARELGEAAKRAVEEGGSSHSNLISLIEELKATKKGAQEQCHDKA